MDLEHAMSSRFSLDETEMERAARDAARRFSQRWLSVGREGGQHKSLDAVAELGLDSLQSAAGAPELAKLSMLAFEELGAADLGHAAELARRLSSDWLSRAGNASGARREDHGGQSGSDTKRREARVPACDPAHGHAVHIVCAVLVGAMRSAVDHAFIYAGERMSFGKPILNHQAVALRLADMVIAVESATLLLHGSACAGRAPTRSEVIALAAHVDASSQLVFRDAVQVLAAHGYVASSRTARWFEAAGPIAAFLREIAHTPQGDQELCSPVPETSHGH